MVGPEGVLGLGLDAVHLGADVAQPRLDLEPVALEPVGELVVARVAGIGQRVAHDDVGRRRRKQRVAGRIRAAVLHRLKHLGHVLPDSSGTVSIDDSCDSTHTDRLSDGLGKAGPIPLADRR